MEPITHSIFEPRQVFDIDKKTGEAVKKDYISPVGVKEYDKYYIKRQVKFVPVPAQEGSDDYVLDMKVIDDKEDIDQVINSQAGDVGLQSMIDKFNRTGDASVLPGAVKATDEVVDFTQLPQDNAEYFDYIHGLAAAYEKLPIELRKDMSVEEFVKSVTEKQVNDYIASITSKNVKEEGKDE